MERITYEQEVLGEKCWQIKGADNSLCKEVCDEHGEHLGCSGCPMGKAINGWRLMRISASSRKSPQG